MATLCRQLKAELQHLRRKGALKVSEDSCPDPERTCGRCRCVLGRVINRGALCQSCRLRVCKDCRQDNFRATDWVCAVCHKRMEIQAASGEWMNEFVRRPSRKRDARVYVPAADIIKKTIRRSWTISNPTPRWAPIRSSAEFRPYNSLPRAQDISNYPSLVFHQEIIKNNEGKVLRLSPNRRAKSEDVYGERNVDAGCPTLEITQSESPREPSPKRTPRINPLMSLSLRESKEVRERRKSPKRKVEKSEPEAEAKEESPKPIRKETVERTPSRERHVSFDSTKAADLAYFRSKSFTNSEAKKMPFSTRSLPEEAYGRDETEAGSSVEQCDIEPLSGTVFQKMTVRRRRQQNMRKMPAMDAGWKRRSPDSDFFDFLLPDGEDYRLVFVNSDSSSKEDDVEDNDSSSASSFPLDECDWDYFEPGAPHHRPTQPPHSLLGWGGGSPFGSPRLLRRRVGESPLGSPLLTARRLARDSSDSDRVSSPPPPSSSSSPPGVTAPPPPPPQMHCLTTASPASTTTVPATATNNHNSCCCCKNTVHQYIPVPVPIPVPFPVPWNPFNKVMNGANVQQQQQEFWQYLQKQVQQQWAGGLSPHLEKPMIGEKVEVREDGGGDGVDFVREERQGREWGLFGDKRVEEKPSEGGQEKVDEVAVVVEQEEENMGEPMGYLECENRGSSGSSSTDSSDDEEGENLRRVYNVSGSPNSRYSDDALPSSAETTDNEDQKSSADEKEREDEEETSSGSADTDSDDTGTVADQKPKRFSRVFVVNHKAGSGSSSSSSSSEGLSEEDSSDEDTDTELDCTVVLTNVKQLEEDNVAEEAANEEVEQGDGARFLCMRYIGEDEPKQPAKPRPRRFKKKKVKISMEEVAKFIREERKHCSGDHSSKATKDCDMLEDVYDSSSPGLSDVSAESLSSSSETNKSDPQNVTSESEEDLSAPRDLDLRKPTIQMEEKKEVRDLDLRLESGVEILRSPECASRVSTFLSVAQEEQEKVESFKVLPEEVNLGEPEADQTTEVKLRGSGDGDCLIEPRTASESVDSIRAESNSSNLMNPNSYSDQFEAHSPDPEEAICGSLTPLHSVSDQSDVGEPKKPYQSDSHDLDDCSTRTMDPEVSKMNPEESTETTEGPPNRDNNNKSEFRETNSAVTSEESARAIIENPRFVKGGVNPSSSSTGVQSLANRLQVNNNNNNNNNAAKYTSLVMITSSDNNVVCDDERQVNVVTSDTTRVVNQNNGDGGEVVVSHTNGRRVEEERRDEDCANPQQPPPVTVITSAETLSAFEEGLADDDSWVEDLSHDDQEDDDDDFPTNSLSEENSSSSGDEVTLTCSAVVDQEDELRGYHRTAIDFTLHTIVEESCEESEVEQAPRKNKKERPASATDLEKYFFFGLGDGNVPSMNSNREDTYSETSSIYSEGLESLGGMDEPQNENLEELASSRLEKYFLSGFMGFTAERRDSDGSVGSDSEGKPSPEQRRKRLVRARGTGRSHNNSLDNLDTVGSEQQADAQNISEDSSSSDSDEVLGFETPDGQFDTVKRKKIKKQRASLENLETTQEGDKSEEDEDRNKTPQPELLGSNLSINKNQQQSRDSGFVGSCDDLLKDVNKSPDQERKTDPVRRKSVTESLPPATNLTRKDSFNNWSSDEETNLMMSKMRQFFKTMVANNTAKANVSSPKPFPRARNRCKPPQLVYFENELTRLMKTVPGIREDQVREIVEYLSSEDTWSDSYDSSDYTSSDLEGSALQQQISDSCKQIINKFDTEDEEGDAGDGGLNKETTFVYQKLVASFEKIATEDKPAPNSPPLIAKVMHHIGSRLVALMHEVSSGESHDSNSPKARNHHRRLVQKLSNASATTTDEESTSDSNTFMENSYMLPRSKSHDLLVNKNLHQSIGGVSEISEEPSDCERFSWRGSFESALLATDSRNKLSLIGNESSASAIAAKRRSAGDLLFSHKSLSREQLDRVRSCGSIISEDKQLWNKPNRRRSSVPDTASCGSGGSADGEEEDEDLEARSTLPRSVLNGPQTTNSLPRLPTATLQKAQSHHHLLSSGGGGGGQNVKSARYRPPGFARLMTPQQPKRAASAPGLHHQRRGAGGGGRRSQISNVPSDDVTLSEAHSSPMLASSRVTTVLSGSKSATPSPVSYGSRRKTASMPSQEWPAHDDDIDRLVTMHQNRASLSSLGLRSDSMASVYSGAGEGRYGSVTVRGQVEFGLQYNYKAGALEIQIKQCKDLAPVDAKRNRSDPYVKVYLLPDKSKSGKRKTKVKKHTLNPVFDECLKFHMSLNELELRTLWLSVWHSDMFGRNDFLGEVTMALENKVFDDPTPKWYNLQERTEPFDDMLSFKGDIIVCLKFVPPDMTVHKKGKRSRGSLHILVKEAKALTAVKANGTSDPFCKSYLLPDKGRHAKQKTPVVKRSVNPVWNHTFVYDDVTLQELAERSLELTVWDHDRLASNEFLGMVRFSLGTGKHYGKPVDWMDSTGKELNLWKSMLERPNFWVEGCLPLRPTVGTRMT
ncbi:uncharacterized protein LOC126736703 isoform X2 [Anthonomus grandis grandis]|uniref:uncharacterized protein LOC126736703 isoform X2 n=1 Tax=Anthonomus grandis grandis TaxID=2921223 RepID=UPI002166A795|nr:uncharacterized protein LOC126736703 isoform X2 [Anthonomus grandis grandis]